jgi:hypothetical protein
VTTAKVVTLKGFLSKDSISHEERTMEVRPISLDADERRCGSALNVVYLDIEASWPDLESIEPG